MVNELAYEGRWSQLLDLLKDQSHLVNSASEVKGYTPLHQAAWHGAKPAVIGALLALGANPTLRTQSKFQTARDIALEKHPGRGDLGFLLADRGRTASQLIRKVVAEDRQHFGPYDGNQVICDRLIEALGADTCCSIDADLERRLTGAFQAVTGAEWSGRPDMVVSAGPSFDMHASPGFWADHFLSAFRDYAAKYQVIPIERHWATTVDLFSPHPEGWGLRGDLFLWLEMKAVLNHVPIPESDLELRSIMASLFHVLTGAPMASSTEVHVARFERGGLSSGVVSAEFWRDSLIPMLQRRAAWLRESWSPL
ncbi:hypothetical protein [Roseateles sp.]|uniref:hypothetical protein n=1 Tax=Roseateles sp. TaxID=1971397 RepID=UPI003925B75B